MGASVPDQVEFHVTAASVELEVALALAPRQLAPAGYDRPIGREVGVTHGSEERERLGETELVEIVEEQSADAARFLPVLQIKVLVAGAFETRIVFGAERRDGGACGFMPVHRVGLKAIVGRQVEAAPEPPHGIGGVGARDKEADVRMAGRQVRVARVDHQRHPDGLPCFADELRAVGGGGSRQPGAVHMGECDAGLFEEFPLRQDARPPAPAESGLIAVGPLPVVRAKSRAPVLGGKGGANRVLQRVKVGADRAEIGSGKHGGWRRKRIGIVVGNENEVGRGNGAPSLEDGAMLRVLSFPVDTRRARVLADPPACNPPFSRPSL